MTTSNNSMFDPQKLNFRQCLRQVKQEVEKLVSNLPIKPPDDLKKINESDWAFMVYGATYLFFDGKFDTQTFNTWLTEGYSDQKIDLIVSLPNGKSLRIYIVQFKHEDTFKSNVLQLLDTGLTYVFREKDKYKKLNNQRLVRRVQEIRELQKSYDSIDVSVQYVTRAQTHGGKIPSLVDLEKQRIEAQWASHPFDSFKVELLGPQNLVAYQLSAKYSIPDEDLTLRIQSGQTNQGRWLEYISPQSNIKSLVFTTTAADLAKFVQGNDRWVFDENVRVFQGIRKDTVNDSIYKSCIEDERAEYFWLLNNGVTITCKKCIPPRVPDHSEIVLRSPQIVNGCQTSMILLSALEENKLQPDASLLVRVIETQDANLVDSITTATNSQKAVKLRDLRSNDSHQRTLKMSVSNFGRYYETKPGEYKALSVQEKRLVVSNEKCGQACLAVLFKLPSIAMSQKSVIWEDSKPGRDNPPGYEQIFGQSAEKLLYAYSLYKYSDTQQKEWMKKRRDKSAKARETVDEAVNRNGVFHLARIMSFYLSEDQTDDENLLEQLIQEIDLGSRNIKKAYTKARKVLRQVLFKRKRQRGGEFVNYVNEIRSREINTAITQYLRTNP